MPIYKIEGDAVHPVAPARFGAAHDEDRLETILQASGERFGVCFIARQPHTDHGKRPDLIGIAADGAVEVWELKRGRAPRDIVAQALEYAVWAGSGPTRSSSPTRPGAITTGSSASWGTPWRGVLGGWRATGRPSSA